MTDAIINISKSLTRLIRVQEKMLTIMQASTRAMEVQTRAVSDLGDSASTAATQIQEVETFLTRFIGTADSGFLRKTVGKTGFFHRMMYGVPGYFIFKNRLDGILSVIDSGLLKPIKRAVQGGPRQEGFLNTLIYGTVGSYQKTRQQLGGIASKLGSIDPTGVSQGGSDLGRGNRKNKNRKNSC